MPDLKEYKYPENIQNSPHILLCMYDYTKVESKNYIGDAYEYDFNKSKYVKKFFMYIPESLSYSISNNWEDVDGIFKTAYQDASKTVDELRRGNTTTALLKGMDAGKSLVKAKMTKALAEGTLPLVGKYATNAMKMTKGITANLQETLVFNGNEHLTIDLEWVIWNYDKESAIKNREFVETMAIETLPGHHAPSVIKNKKGEPIKDKKGKVSKDLFSTLKAPNVYDMYVLIPKVDLNSTKLTVSSKDEFFMFRPYKSMVCTGFDYETLNNSDIENKQFYTDGEPSGWKVKLSLKTMYKPTQGIFN